MALTVPRLIDHFAELIAANEPLPTILTLTPNQHLKLFWTRGDRERFHFLNSFIDLSIAGASSSVNVGVMRATCSRCRIKLAVASPKAARGNDNGSIQQVPADESPRYRASVSFQPACL